MTSHEERKQVIVLLNESTTAGARQTKACEVFRPERTYLTALADGWICSL